ncbi:Mu transposase C-terminal domain-containing protein [Fibrella sp. WM1]|uniref:Mu transposase C-terminal domain-containing protein n=1 Tax=Fibrella musci TaxID=3242485 RepID=UPI0035209CBC
MKIVADNWYVSFRELVEHCDVAEVTIKQGHQRGSTNWQLIPDPDDKRKRLIRYDTLAPRYQALVRKNLCKGLEPHEVKIVKADAVLSERSLSELLNLAITDGYKRLQGLYTTDCSKRNKSLARAAAIVETIGRYVVDNRLGWKSYGPFEEAVKWLEENWSDYSRWKDVPMTKIRLKEKVMLRMVGTERMQELNSAPGPVAITEVVALKREDNQNREKFINSFPQPLAWAMQLATLGSDQGGNPNYSDAHIIRIVSECCEMQGIDVPARSWFTNLFAKPNIKRIRSQYRWEKGSRHATKYESYRPIEGATHAGDCWMMDGTRINFIDHTSPDGSQESLYIVVVYDVYSGDVLGWTWCYNEDHVAYVNALKMAVQTAGYLPFELVFDKFPGHNTDQWGYQERGKKLNGVCKQLDKRGVHLTCTVEASGKAPVERWISTFQDVFLQNSAYYYGQGVKSSNKAAHRTSDYLKQITRVARDENFDFNAAWREAEYWLQAYRLTPYADYSRSKSILDVCPKLRHEQSKRPLCIEVRTEEVVDIFWLTKPLQINRDIIKMRVFGQDVFYPIQPEYATLKHYDEVSVRYDETDLSGVYVFSKTGEFLAYLEQGSKTKRYGIDKPRANKERLSYIAGQQAIQADKDTELARMREGGDDVRFLMGPRNPKALREAAESSQRAELVSAQMSARYPKKTPQMEPVDIVVFNVEELVRAQY